MMHSLTVWRVILQYEEFVSVLLHARRNHLLQRWSTYHEGSLGPILGEWEVVRSFVIPFERAILVSYSYRLSVVNIKKATFKTVVTVRLDIFCEAVLSGILALACLCSCFLKNVPSLPDSLLDSFGLRPHQLRISL